MNSNYYKNEIVDADEQQSFRRIRPQWYEKTTHSSTPNLYEQTVTTTTTTTVNKEANAVTDEMTTTNLEKSPIRRVNLVTGPRSAYARLFPDKYRQEQDDLPQTHYSPLGDDQRYNFDYNKNQRMSSNIDDSQSTQKARQVSFEDECTEEYFINESSRTRAETCLDENLSRVPLNFDPDPEIIYRDNPNKLVYRQKIGVRYLKPPTPPPPEPIIVREVQATPPEEPPPLIISSTPPPPPRTPSPWVVRERPPTPPLHEPTKIITKTLPPPPAPPRRVIIKRVPPLPAKPRPLIIEKWLPYKTPPERPVIYQRVPPSEPVRQPQRNLILQYQPAQVRIEQEVQNVGCFRVDPNVYCAKFGTSLRRTDSIRKVLQDIGCDPNLITSAGNQKCYGSTQDNPASLSSSHYDYPRQKVKTSTTKTCFTDDQLATLLNTDIIKDHHYDVPSTSTNQNRVQYTTILSRS